MALTSASVRLTAYLGVIFLAVQPSQCAVQADQAPPSLFGQTAQRVLDQRFPSRSISYLLLDAQSDRTLAQQWPDGTTPIPVGSLIKPFTAFVYAQHHRRFPVVICHGQADACWLPRGHGRLTLTSAIAESCNAYFLALGRAIRVSEANQVLATYSLPALDQQHKALTLAGLDNDWRAAPPVFAHAYLELVRRSRSGLHAGEDEEILRGMQQSAQAGTARAADVHFPVLAKTGTAQCTHHPRGAADGFTVLLFPADDPRLLLFVRLHGATGAATAKVAGQMLKALEPESP